MKINTIYPAFQGEQNIWGLGAPVIFLRTQGCHLRCYKSTLGTLCDTPEALEGRGTHRDMTVKEVLAEMKVLANNMGGVYNVCLTGGDPLWMNQIELLDLLHVGWWDGFNFSVETSGTLPIKNFVDLIIPGRDKNHVHWVLDYKTKSAGVDRPFLMENLFWLDEQDYIKFVLYDSADYQEFLDVLPTLETKAKITVGVYWGGKITNFQLYDMLLKDKLLGQVSLNVQLHKMAFFCDARVDQLHQVAIPAEI